MPFQNTQGSNVSGDSYDGQGVQFEQSMSSLGKLYLNMFEFMTPAISLLKPYPVGESEEVNRAVRAFLLELRYHFEMRVNEFNVELSEYLDDGVNDGTNDHLGSSLEKKFKETLRIGFLYYLCDKILLAVAPEDRKMIINKFMIDLNSLKSDIKEEIVYVLKPYFEDVLAEHYKNNKFVEDCMTIEPKVHSALLFPHDFPLERYRDYDPSGQPEDNQADGINTENPKLEVAKIISNIKLLDANGQFYPAKIDISYNFVCQFCDAQVPIDQLQQEFKHSDTCRRESEICVDQGINYVDFSRKIIEQIAELPSI